MAPGVCKLVFVFLLVTVCCFTGRVSSDFSAVAPNIVVQDFQLQGNGSLATTSLVITLGAPTTASVLYHGTAQNVLDGFTTTMVMSITECDEIVWGRGADGFAFIIASEINMEEDVDFGGSLSLSYKTNIAYIGFDLFEGLLMYNATDVGVTVDSVGAETFSLPELKTWRCSNYPITFLIDYTPPSTFRILASRPTDVNTVVTDHTLELDITRYFSPGKHYLALSGATGQAYMRQEFSSWEFKSKADVVPILECYEDLGGGLYSAHFGYENKGILDAHIDISPMNSFTPEPQDRGQVKQFSPGRSQFYPVNAFSVNWDGSELTWNLTNNFVSFAANTPSLLCPTNLTFAIVFTAPENLTDSQITTIVQSLANFLGISASRIRVVGYEFQLVGKRSTQEDPFATLELEISGTGPDTANEPSAAEAVQQFVQSAANTTAVNEIIDPDGSAGRGYLSTSLKETGTNGTGSLTPVAPPVMSPVTTPSSTPVNEQVPSSQTPSLVPTSTPQGAITSSSSLATPVYSIEIMFVNLVLVLAE